jgi:hypothetical protein
VLHHAVGAFSRLAHVHENSTSGVKVRACLLKCQGRTG